MTAVPGFCRCLLLLVPVIAFANNVQALELPSPQQRADQAYAEGDRDLARTLYGELLELNPRDSRATYRLATLQPPGSDDALRLYREYVRLEPQDPWGHMALGDALGAAGRLDEARDAYRRAFQIAPGETDAFVGLGRLLIDAERGEEAAEVYRRWTDSQPENPSAWRELGKAQQYSRRYRESSVALAKAYNLEPAAESERLLRRSLYQTAPAVQPLVGSSQDSDDVKTVRSGVLGDWQFSDRSRLGFRVQRSEVSDPFADGTADEFGVTYRWQPRRNIRVQGGAGIARLDPGTSASGESSITTYDLRARLDSPRAGPAGELRIQQYPLLSSPGLLRDPVEVSELRGMVEVPIKGPARARFRLRTGALESAIDRNSRTGYDGAFVYRLGPTAELNANFQQLGYTDDTTAGYSAPERLQTVEIGTYAELYDYWPLTLVVDAAIGLQRRDEQDEPAGEWGDAIRFWGQVSWDLRPNLRLDLELEASNSQEPASGSTPSTDWSYTSIMVSMRFGIGDFDARRFAANRTRLADAR